MTSYRATCCLLLFIASFITCKSRSDSTLDDVTTLVVTDPTGMLIPISPAELKKVSRVDISSGPVVVARDWNERGDSEEVNYEKNMTILRSAFPDSSGVAGSGNLDTNSSLFFDLKPASVSASQSEIKLSAALGFDLITIPLLERNGSPYIRFANLAEIISRCPADLSTNETLRNYMKKFAPSLTLTIEPDTFLGQKPFEISGLTVTEDRINLDIVCNFLGNFKEQPNEHGMPIQLFSKIEMRFNAKLIELHSDKSFAPMKLSDHETESGRRGTKYYTFSNSNMNPDQKLLARTTVDTSKTIIMRWNMAKRNIVIDDIWDTDGRKLESLNFGAMYVHGVRSAVESIRSKFPELGKKIILKTESTGSVANLALRFAREERASGRGNVLFENTTGEILQAGVNIDVGPKERSRIHRLKEEGLSFDEDKDFSLFVDYTVMHEIGHALGLRHNFEGYYADTDGVPKISAVMSYANLLLPLSLFGSTIEYGDHDILSLKYLYADLLGNADLERPRIKEALFRYRFISDESGGPVDFLIRNKHLERAIEFIEGSSHPLVIQFRSNSDWKNRLKGL